MLPTYWLTREVRGRPGMPEGGVVEGDKNELRVTYESWQLE